MERKGSSVYAGVIVMKDAVTLVKVQEGYGHNAENTEQKKQVRGCVSLPSTTMQLNAQAVGVKVDKVVHLWRSEYESGTYTYLETGGVRYRIITAGASINDMLVKLTVARK